MSASFINTATSEMSFRPKRNGHPERVRKKELMNEIDALYIVLAKGYSPVHELQTCRISTFVFST